jgi:hypothetical protein
VGVLALLVGQACAPSSPPPVAPVSPDLEIKPLDPSASARVKTPAPGGSVRFGHPVPAPGSAWTVKLHAVSKSEEQVSTYDSDYRVEVIAVDGPAPSRVRLKFLRNVHAYQGRVAPTAIDGREYVVDARAPHVRDATDAPAPEAETQRVLDIFPDLGTRARIDEVLPDEAMHIGERRDELAAAILRIIHPRAWSLRAGSAALARVEGDDAVFKVSIDANSESGLHLEVAGEAHVRIRDARLSDLALDGGYDTKQKDGGSEPPGIFTLHRSVR